MKPYSVRFKISSNQALYWRLNEKKSKYAFSLRWICGPGFACSGFNNEILAFWALDYVGFTWKRTAYIFLDCRCCTNSINIFEDCRCRVLSFFSGPLYLGWKFAIVCWHGFGFIRFKDFRLRELWYGVPISLFRLFIENLCLLIGVTEEFALPLKKFAKNMQLLAHISV